MSIILQGNIEYNGFDVVFTVSKKEDKNIDVQIAFTNGPKKVENNFSFKKVNNKKNKWKLDTSKHQSDIDIFFEEKDENFILSASEPNVKMVFDAQLGNLYIVNEDDDILFDFNNRNAFNFSEEKMYISFDKIFEEMSFFEKLISWFNGTQKDIENAFNDLFNKTNNTSIGKSKSDFTSPDKPNKSSEVKNYTKEKRTKKASEPLAITQLLGMIKEKEAKESKMLVSSYTLNKFKNKITKKKHIFAKRIRIDNVKKNNISTIC